jgi:TonB family protein
MKTMDANRNSSGYELRGELARLCLPEANRDPNRKLAWMNSICILFLIIGIFGARSAAMPLRQVPAVEEIIPALIEPVPTPTTDANQNENQNDQEKTEAPQVVVVTPEVPSINFSVPTIGNLIAPSALAQAPPLRPMQPPAPLRTLPTTLNNTGSGGARPQPPYPKIALDQGQQGGVTLLMRADDAGNLLSVEVKDSSGFPVLDHSAVDFIRRHWTVSPGGSNRLFQATITYQLQTN